ncbi:hypothetical protein [Actibacterium ureilyticum]|uniref:hypothetical protein n=1 Tax=Actibacterium ureilyticum TaxID=1590614 RepID=UPI000BAAEE25|nr:hypothetical protein [Actibacterium ureilyticum]
MSSRLETLRAQIRELQNAFQQEVDERRAQFRYRVEKRRVVFEAEMRKAHREAREGWLSFLSRARPMVILTAPLIYGLIIPFALLDLFVSVYHAVCFRVYGIPRVRRADYIAIDRQHLAYLNGLQKLNCIYCGYCNGLIAYVREVASRTEQYWCPIKHARRLTATHARYDGFVDYGDATGFRARMLSIRDDLADEAVTETTPPATAPPSDGPQR